MKLSDIKHGKRSLIEIEPLGADTFGSVQLLSDAMVVAADNGAAPILRIGDEAWAVRGVQEKDDAALTALLDRALPRISWVAARLPAVAGTQATSLAIETREFPAAHYWPEQFDIGIDDKIVDALRRKSGELSSVAQVVKRLQDEFIVPTKSGPTLVLLSVGRGVLAERESAFRLHGRDWTVDVKRGIEEKFIAERVVFASNSHEESDQQPILLVRGNFSFVDHTVAGQFRGNARSELDQIVRSSDSYLGVWREYNRLERRNILRRAKEFGWHAYSSCDELPDGTWRFRLTPNSRLEGFIRSLEEEEAVSLEASAAPPEDLLIEEPREDGEDPTSRRGNRSFGGEYLGFNRQGHTLDLRQSFQPQEGMFPPPNGVLHIGLTGDRKRLERRLEAQTAIVSASSPMPQLGLLLEGKVVPVRRRSSVKPLSSAAKDAFKGEPTERQIEAVSIALNTPDIALIQGPPGTGKTRTIAAINTRLSELADDKNGVAARFLLSSYQHDAVENVANVAQAYGLPAIKVGGRRSQEAAAVDGVDRWRNDRIEAVRARLGSSSEPPLSRALRTCRDLAISYLNAPCVPGELSVLLSEVREAAAFHISSELLDQLIEMQLRFRSPTGRSDHQDIELNRAIAAVRGLRTDEQTFGDDGHAQALKALRRLEPFAFLELHESELLKRAAEWETGQVQDFLIDLEALKGRLIERLSAMTQPITIPVINQDVALLLGQIISELQATTRSSSAGVDSALDEYLSDLENDADGVREAVERYTAVLAATCQQAVGYQMGQIKLDGSAFDTVIVDEAARANPLDLLIPMSRAERRVILVGDHRQLPHILDIEIENELESEVSDKTREMLKKSMFQRLFLQLRELEKRDGIKRTATLNRQYRMHPLLGDFVSSTFYEPYGEGFESGLEAEAFHHGLSRYGDAVAAWVDVPVGRGQERAGQSKSRVEEATWIAEEAYALMSERPDLSVGVISFYAAQVDELLRQMERLGMAEMGDNGSYRISPSWQATRSESGTLVERLRVGTVDSFQGKEFDVVFLSMTRSNKVGVDNPKLLRKKFGHLLLENRLCVAMSRQKRLLILVGDSGMLKDEKAADAVPGLARFLELCKGDHGAIISA